MDIDYSQWGHEPIFDPYETNEPDPSAAVYVWLTTTAFDNRKSKAKYESQATSSQDAGNILRSVGHVAIKVTYGGSVVYGSFCPQDHYKDLELLNPLGSFKSKFNSQKEDRLLMKSRPERTILLNNLDFQKMQDFMLNLSKDWNDYNLYKRNCSTLVKTILKIGSGNRQPTFFEKVKYFSGDAMDVVKAGGFALATTSSQRNLALIAMRDSSPLRMLDHFFKYLGGDTPDSVLRYASFLSSFNR